MFSLDAKTGLPDPNFGNGGRVDLRLNDDQVMDPTKGIIGLHAPPLVVKVAPVAELVARLEREYAEAKGAICG